MMGNCKSKRKENPDSCNDFASAEGASASEETNTLKKHMCDIQGPCSNSSPKINTLKQKTNLDVIDSTRIEICNLLERIHEFYGTSENDKNYRFVDEMLTRVLIELDKLHCNNVAERIYRKTTISGANQAITILERKLKINNDIKKLETNLTE